jgi:hypothetical protein
MPKEAIRFHKIDSDAELVAVAEVSLFSGVYLRGWYILEKGDQIEVLAPHRMYRDPVTGEEKVFELLKFEDDKTAGQWRDRVKQEYLRWINRGESIAD